MSGSLGGLGFAPEKSVQWDHINVYRHFMEGCKKGLISVVPSGMNRENGHKLNYKKIHSK